VQQSPCQAPLQPTSIHHQLLAYRKVDRASIRSPKDINFGTPELEQAVMIPSNRSAAARWSLRHVSASQAAAPMLFSSTRPGHATRARSTLKCAVRDESSQWGRNIALRPRGFAVVSNSGQLLRLVFLIVSIMTRR
jgi:hypothetical protein